MLVGGSKISKLSYGLLVAHSNITINDKRCVCRHRHKVYLLKSLDVSNESELTSNKSFLVSLMLIFC